MKLLVLFCLAVIGTCFILMVFHDLKGIVEDETAAFVSIVPGASPVYGDYVYDNGTHKVAVFIEEKLGDDNDLYAVCVQSNDNGIEVYRCIPSSLDVVDK